MTKPKTRSRGELKIADILRSNNIPFAEEYIFPDLVSSSGRPLRFDFAVFDDEGNVDFVIMEEKETLCVKNTMIIKSVFTV